MGFVNQTIKLPMHAVAALSIIDLLTHLGLELHDQISLLEGIIFDKKLFTGFRELSTPLTTLGRLIVEKTSTFVDQPDETIIILTSLQYRHALLQNFTERLKLIQNQGRLSCPPNSIYQSLFHMSCNRLMGVDHEREKSHFICVSYSE